MTRSRRIMSTAMLLMTLSGSGAVLAESSDVDFGMAVVASSAERPMQEGLDTARCFRRIAAMVADYFLEEAFSLQSGPSDAASREPKGLAGQLVPSRLGVDSQGDGVALKATWNF